MLWRTDLILAFLGDSFSFLSAPPPLAKRRRNKGKSLLEQNEERTKSVLWSEKETGRLVERSLPTTDAIYFFY